MTCSFSLIAGLPLGVASVVVLRWLVANGIYIHSVVRFTEFSTYLEFIHIDIGDSY